MRRCGARPAALASRQFGRGPELMPRVCTITRNRHRTSIYMPAWRACRHEEAIRKRRRDQDAKARPAIHRQPLMDSQLAQRRSARQVVAKGRVTGATTRVLRRTAFFSACGHGGAVIWRRVPASRVCRAGGRRHQCDRTEYAAGCLAPHVAQAASLSAAGMPQAPSGSAARSLGQTCEVFRRGQCDTPS